MSHDVTSILSWKRTQVQMDPGPGPGSNQQCRTRTRRTQIYDAENIPIAICRRERVVRIIHWLILLTSRGLQPYAPNFSLQRRRRVSATHHHRSALARDIVDRQEDRRRPGRVDTTVGRSNERQRIAARRNGRVHEHQTGAGMEAMRGEAEVHESD